MEGRRGWANAWPAGAGWPRRPNSCSSLEMVSSDVGTLACRPLKRAKLRVGKGGSAVEPVLPLAAHWPRSTSGWGGRSSSIRCLPISRARNGDSSDEPELGSGSSACQGNLSCGPSPGSTPEMPKASLPYVQPDQGGDTPCILIRLKLDSCEMAQVTQLATGVGRAGLQLVGSLVYA